jgi:hypothetical protein
MGSMTTRTESDVCEHRPFVQVYDLNNVWKKDWCPECLTTLATCADELAGSNPSAAV